MSLAVVKNPPPADPLAALHSERADLQRQIADNAATITRLKILEGVKASVLATIGDIGRREIEAMTEWAKAGCSGDAPAPLSDERADAAKRLAAARLQIESAEAVRGELEARQAEASASLGEIDARIDAAILHVLETDFHAANKKFSRALADARLLAADVFGARAAILSQAETLKMRGRIEEAVPIFRRVEELDRQPIDVDANPLGAEVAAAAEAASRRALAMKAGEAASAKEFAR